jgi:hypothetical protein
MKFFKINAFTVIIIILITLIWSIHLSEFAINVPFFDAWDFNSPIFEGGSLYSSVNLLHGPHRQGLGGLVQYFILSVTNFNFKIIPYASIVLILFGSILILCAFYKLRVKVENLNIFLLSVCMALMSQEVVTMNPNLAHGSIPFLLFSVIFYLHCSDCINNWRNGSIPIVLILLTFTGFSFIFSYIYLFIICIYFMLEKDKINLLPMVVFTSLICILFLVGYKSNPAIACFKQPSFLYFSEYFKFTVYVISRPVMISEIIYSSFPLLALIIASSYTTVLLIIVALLVKNFKRNPVVNSLLLSMALYTIIFSFLTAIGRSCSGDVGAFGGRYYLYSLPGFFSIILYYILNSSNKIFVNSTSLFIATIIIFLLNIVWEKNNHKDFIDYASVKKGWIQCVNNGGTITICTKEFVIYPVPSAIENRAAIFLKNKK